MTPAKRPRHIHLGERLEAIDSIRRGERTAEEVAAAMEVATAEVLRWMEIHAGDQVLRVEEVVVSPEVRRLSVRAQLLLDLIEGADAEIRALVQLLIHGRREETAPGE